MLDLDLGRAASVEVVFADADATGTAFSLARGAIGGFGLDGIQEHRFGRAGLRDDVLSRIDGSRWTSGFVAAPDGSGAAVGPVHGLEPMTCILQVLPPYVPAEEPIEVKLVAGETTRVEVCRKGRPVPPTDR